MALTSTPFSWLGNKTWMRSKKKKNASGKLSKRMIKTEHKVGHNEEISMQSRYFTACEPSSLKYKTVDKKGTPTIRCIAPPRPHSQRPTFLPKLSTGWIVLARRGWKHCLNNVSHKDRHLVLFVPRFRLSPICAISRRRRLSRVCKIHSTQQIYSPPTQSVNIVQKHDVRRRLVNIRQVH